MSLESAWLRVCIRLNNQVIVVASQLLSKPKFSGVEKIKTIGSTYMAATGLSAVPSQEYAQVQVIPEPKRPRSDHKLCCAHNLGLSDQGLVRRDKNSGGF